MKITMMRRLIVITSMVLLSLLCSSALAQRPELYIQSGHSRPIANVVFSPNGTIVASNSYNDLKLWDLASRRELMTLKPRSGFFGSIAFSPDSKFLATAGSDNIIRFWDVNVGQETGIPLTGHTQGVLSLSYNSDGRLLASIGSDKTVRLWDTNLKTQSRSIPFSAFVLGSVALSPDGKLVVAGGSDERGSSVIKVWDVASGIQLQSFEPLLVGNTSPPKLIFSADGKTLLMGGNIQIRLWDVASGKEIRTLVRPTAIYWIAISPDGQTVAAGDSGSTTLWQGPSWEAGDRLKGHACIGCAEFGSGAFSPDGKLIAHSDGNTVFIRDVNTKEELKPLKGHTDPVLAVALSPDGSILATANGYGPTRLWNVKSGQEMRSLVDVRNHNYYDHVVFSPNGKLIGTRGALWDVASGQELPGFQLSAEDGYSPNSVVFSADGKHIAGWTYLGTVGLWNLATRQLIRVVKHPANDSKIAFSPDSQVLAIATKDIQFFDVPTGKLLKVLPGHPHTISSVVFSPDGNTLITASDTIKLWDVKTGLEKMTLSGHATGFETVIVSPNGKLIVSLQFRGRLTVWDIATGQELRSLKQQTNDVRAITFHSDNRTLISGSEDGSVRLWDLNTGNHRASLVALDDKEWLVATADGLFDGTPEGWQQANWRFSRNLYDLAPIEIFFGDYYYPGLLADVFAGKNPIAPANLVAKDRRQPKLELNLLDGDATGPRTERNVNVAVNVVQAEAGAKDVRLFRNGLLVKSWRGDVLSGSNTAHLRATIPIVAGENRLTAYAFNRDNIKSSDAILTINGAESLKRKGVAYVLAIGVNSYANAQYNLRYAVTDAEEFATEVTRQQTKIGRYEKVEVVHLLDREATKANILKSLTMLSSKMQPEDALMIFFSGHGTAQKNRFYLIPHDLGYSGSRTHLTNRGLQAILSHSISDVEIEVALANADAGQILLIIDACNSGQALEAEEKRRGPMNSKGLAQLAYEKGMYILTASQSYQVARETAKLGHGFLTYALVEEGLKTMTADQAPPDGQVLLREWLDYATRRVPQIHGIDLMEKLKTNKQLVQDEVNPVKERLQRPRVFYRRDAETIPLIVARP